MHTPQPPHAVHPPTLTVPDFIKLKKPIEKSPWSLATMPLSQDLAKTAIDCVLVGDSCAMVVYGEKTTIPATVAMIAHHVQAVRRDFPRYSLSRTCRSSATAKASVSC